MSDTVTSTLFYFDGPKDGSRPWQHVDIDPTTGERPSNFGVVQKEAQIENVRGKESSYSLDTSGFQYFTHPSAHKQFTDNEEIKREYYPESVALLKKLTGANRVVIFDHSMCLVFNTEGGLVTHVLVFYPAIRRHRPGELATSEDKRQPVSTIGHNVFDILLILSRYPEFMWTKRLNQQSVEFICMQPNWHPNS